jgi:heterodisulfide reductase subunit C
VISDRQLDRDFARKVAARPGGEALRLCFACGTCSASCPVGRFDARFNPRRIIRMTLLGMREQVLASDFVWLCAGCHTCSERCPQGVHIPDIMVALKNMAREEGHVHPTLAKQIELLRDFGRVFEIEEYDNKRRAKMGLPELKPVCDEVRTILKRHGLA